LPENNKTKVECLPRHLVIKLSPHNFLQSNVISNEKKFVFSNMPFNKGLSSGKILLLKKKFCQKVLADS